MRLIFLSYCSTRLILQCYLVLRDVIPIQYGLVRLILFTIILRDYLPLLHESVRLILFLLFYAINLSILFVSTRLSSPTLWFCGIDPLIVFDYVRFTPFYTLWSHARKPSSPILWFCVFHLFLFFGPTRFSLFYLINMRLICDEYMQVYFFLKLCNILLLSML